MNGITTNRNRYDILLPLATAFACLHVDVLVAAKKDALSHTAFVAFILLSLSAPMGAFLLVPRLSSRTRKIFCSMFLVSPMIVPAAIVGYLLYAIVFIVPKD